MPSAAAATIIVPTTGDRGALLPYSVGSALSQSVRDIEVFIMGDGVAESTRHVIAQMMHLDSRIRFFDHPKHARRGEPYRHAALAEARGEIVCYLTDRDLMLPNHVDVMRQLLTSADFAHTLRFGISPRGGFTFQHTLDITNRRDRKVAISKSGLLIPLSFAGHTLSMYRRLPHGWRITPTSEPTDRYMWQQFLAQADCQVATSTKPTILYFKRGDHPGLPVDQRVLELSHWSEKMQNPDWISDFSETVRDSAIRDRARIAREARDAAKKRVAQSTGRWATIRRFLHDLRRSRQK